MGLISISLILALILSYSLTKKYIQDEFSSLKIDVLDQTIEPYNQLFQKNPTLIALGLAMAPCLAISLTRFSYSLFINLPTLI